MRRYVLQFSETGNEWDWNNSEKSHEYIEGCYEEAGEMFDKNDNLEFRIKEVEDGENVGYIRMRTSSLQIFLCPICNKAVRRHDMQMSTDCHGIAYRPLCHKCWEKVMETKGYDGEYYGPEDENY